MVVSFEIAVRYPSSKAVGALSGLGAGAPWRACLYPARKEAKAEWKRDLASPGWLVWHAFTVGVGVAWLLLGV